MNEAIQFGKSIVLSHFSLLLILCFFSGMNTADANEPSARPNVLMICVDDLNDWVGYLGGHPQTKTPHLDALAKRGRAFTNAHCSVPVCSASRVSVMSGLHATSHGSYELGPSYLSIPKLKDVPTLQGYFQQHGYYTLSGGKVLHSDFKGKLAKDIDQILSRKRGGPKPPKPLHWMPQVWDWGAFPETDAEMYDYQLATAAADALQERYDQPFFMSVGFFRPHVPMYVPPPWFAQFERESLLLPKVFEDDLADVPPNFAAMHYVAPSHQQITAAQQWNGFVHAYLASVAFADHCIGVVMNALDSSPHKDSTIIVLWSDHGFHLGEKEHWAKRTLWEESTRVPLIFAGPKISGSATCGEAVSLLDIYPTLLELCQLPPRANLDGVSLVPQIERASTPRSQPALISSYEGNHAVRDDDWRYIRYADGAEELYDHRVDSGEHHNLANNADYTTIKERLATFLPKTAEPEVIPPTDRIKRSASLKSRQAQNRPVE